MIYTIEVVMLMIMMMTMTAMLIEITTMMVLMTKTMLRMTSMMVPDGLGKCELCCRAESRSLLRMKWFG